MSVPALLRKYGAATTINFELFEVDGVDLRVDAVAATGDTTIMKDEGAEANTTNNFADEGQGYSLALTATEMTAARIVIYVVDQTATKVWLDRTIVIETYGNASAQHAFDLDTATQGVDVVQISGDSTAADNAELMFDGTGYAGGTTKLGVDVVSVSGDSTAADNLELDYDGTGYNKSNSTIGTTTTNTDMRGTDSAALASVVGALTDAAAAGDPTTADTLMQYAKQLINVLVGTTGITTWPAEAAPANNVSLSEAIRAIAADVTGLNGSAMRGTDSAALASVCTEARLSELDAGTGGKMANQVDVIEADTTALNDTKIPDTLSLANINAEVDTALADIGLDVLLSAAPTTANFLPVDDSFLVQMVSKSATATWTDFVNTTDSLQAIRDKQTDIETDTAEIGAAGAGLTVLATAASISALNDISTADVNAQVVDVIRTDTATELSAVPAASPNLHAMVQFMYMAVRNKETQTASARTVANDAGTAIASSTVSDDGTTYTKGEFA